jgi:hypothetical protein
VHSVGALQVGVKVDDGESVRHRWVDFKGC